MQPNNLGDIYPKFLPQGSKACRVYCLAPSKRAWRPVLWSGNIFIL